MALNQRVLGSSPSASTKNFAKIKKLEDPLGVVFFSIAGLRYTLRYKLDVM